MAQEPAPATTAIEHLRSRKNGAGSSGKSPAPTSGKPEVATSGKSAKHNLPLTAADDDDIQFEDEIIETEQGWRLERNSNGYYRWRWQLKNDSGEPVTYVNKSGNTGYKRGSKYVPIEEANRLQ